MKLTIALILLWLCILPVYSRPFIITGKIIDETSGVPVEYASVFIANTTTCTYSNADGMFKLSVSNEGEMNLVVSHVSYQLYNTYIPATKDSLMLLIQLKSQNYKLQGVKIIKKDPNRADKLNAFINGLIGGSKNALNCKILNPSVIYLRGASPQKYLSNWNLSASADSALKIDNASLGYFIQYNLDYFNHNYKGISYYGYPLFEDRITTFKNPKQIIANRQAAYEGSKLHFFRSLYRQTLAEEGFEVFKIAERPKDKDDNMRYGLMDDSVLIGKPQFVMQQTQEPLNIYDYVTVDSIAGSKTLSLNMPFEIRYLKREEESRYNYYPNYFVGIKRNKKAQTTIVKMTNHQIRFYSNGSVEKSDELMTIGYWSFRKLADCVPYNFIPTPKE